MENESAKAIINGNNQMMGQLYKEIASPKDNLILSPMSLHTILSLVYQGSAGATEEAFREVLSVPDKLKTADGYESVMAPLNEVQDVIMEIANRVYVKKGYGIKATFLDIANKKFAASAENIDFSQPTAAQIMNTWVMEVTKNKIKNVIRQDDLDASTSMILINAVYFKGDWADQFDESRTRPDTFYISETDTVPCEMMFRNGKYLYKEDIDLNAHVIELPFRNRALSMIIILPLTRTGIAELEKKIAETDLATLTGNMFSVKVDVSLPKFKIESTIQTNDALSKIGLEQSFGDQADFSELLDSPEPLKISKVIQKAFIEVNEEGAEATEVCSVLVTRRCRPAQCRKNIFRAEHPFCFIIKSETVKGQHVLFQGKLIKPLF